METYIALLRAVNVGGTGKMPMAELRSLAEAAGFQEVRTYIQSGNLIFASDCGAAEVKSLLEAKLADYAGKPVGVILRSAPEIAGVLAANPFAAAEPGKVGVLFLNTAPPADTIEAAKGLGDEEIQLGPREVFIHYPSGMGRSKLRLPVMSEGTVRNLNTVGKLAGMVGG